MDNATVLLFAVCFILQEHFKGLLSRARNGEENFKIFNRKRKQKNRTREIYKQLFKQKRKYFGIQLKFFSNFKFCHLNFKICLIGVIDEIKRN